MQLPPLAVQMTPVTSQLRQFVREIGDGLSGVTSLDLSLHFGSDFYRKAAGTPRSEATSRDIASILAGALPNLRHISINDEVRQAVLIELGARCPLLASMQLLDYDLPAPVLESLFTYNKLPHITHISMGSFLAERDVEGSLDMTATTFRNSHALLSAACACKTVTCLHLGQQHLQKPQEWLALPHSLKELRCFRLPDEGLPHHMVMPRLEKVELTSYEDVVVATQLLGLLQSAEHLQSLSMLPNLMYPLPTDKYCLNVAACGSDAVIGLQLLSQRLEAGLKLHRIMLTAMTVYEDQNNLHEPLIPVREFISMLGSFPGCTHVCLNDEEIYLLDVNAAAAQILAEVGRLFPDAVALRLRGTWQNFDIPHLIMGPSLREISWWGLKHVSREVLVQVLVRMPWLESLSHDARKARTSTRHLQAMLYVAHGVYGSESDISQQVGQWIVSCRPNMLRLVQTWRKRSILSGEIGGVQAIVCKLRWSDVFSCFSC